MVYGRKTRWTDSEHSGSTAPGN